jgi:L-iditol 2-dehydrogenase
LKALILKAYNCLEYAEFPDPQIAPDEILLRVKACGICGSDVHGIDGSTGRRIPPIIMGYEAAGVIAQVGALVPEWKVGDRVTFDITLHCGMCYFCRRGMFNLCKQRRIVGVSTPAFRVHGAFAEYVVVPHRVLYRLPDNLSFEHAALMEPLSVAAHAIRLVSIGLCDTVAVIGAGVIGLLLVQLLRLAGCEQIIAVDVEQERLQRALALGADVALLSDPGKVSDEVHRHTEGRGADVVFEAVGLTQTVQMAVESVREGGTVALIGNLSATVDLPLQKVVTRQLNLIGSTNAAGESEACLRMLASQVVRVDSLISAVAPLSEGASWFWRLYAREPGLIKVILVPED